jgi:hypothetical protein
MASNRHFPSLFFPVWIAALMAVALAAACASSKTDPRCSIKAPSEGYRGGVAKAINGSKLWQAYLEHISPVRDVDQPVIGFGLTFNREITRKTNEGDYDPGVVHAHLTVTNLWAGSEIYSRSDNFPIKDFVFTEKSATREEVQRAAFAATEKTAMRYVHRWVEVAAIRAMGNEGASGSAFISVLEEQTQDPWGDNLIGEAKLALNKIRGF